MKFARWYSAFMDIKGTFRIWVFEKVIFVKVSREAGEGDMEKAEN